MGINTNAVIVVGYTYEEAMELYNKWRDVQNNGYDKFHDWYEDMVIDVVPSYYDAPIEDCLYGTIIKSVESGYSQMASIEGYKNEVENTVKDLFTKFGKTPKLYLSTYIY